jgi:hypothetical protein
MNHPKRNPTKRFLRKITKIGITEQERKVATTIRNVEQFMACIQVKNATKPDGLVYMK